MNIFENLKAYDFERNQICDVLSIVTFWKNAQNRECVILEWTGQQDKKCQK
jgi:hypothetical protein